MGSYERSKTYVNEEGHTVEASIILSRSSDLLIYYRGGDSIFTMETDELENFVSMVMSTGYIELKEYDGKY